MRSLSIRESQLGADHPSADSLTQLLQANPDAIIERLQQSLVHPPENQP